MFNYNLWNTEHFTGFVHSLWSLSVVQLGIFFRGFAVKYLDFKMSSAKFPVKFSINKTSIYNKKQFHGCFSIYEILSILQVF